MSDRERLEAAGWMSVDDVGAWWTIPGLRFTLGSDGEGLFYDDALDIQDYAEAARREGAEAMREACAKVADDCGCDPRTGCACYAVAADIRALDVPGDAITPSATDPRASKPPS